VLRARKVLLHCQNINFLSFHQHRSVQPTFHYPAQSKQKKGFYSFSKQYSQSLIVLCFFIHFLTLSVKLCQDERRMLLKWNLLNIFYTANGLIFSFFFIETRFLYLGAANREKTERRWEMKKTFLPFNFSIFFGIQLIPLLK